MNDVKIIFFCYCVTYNNGCIPSKTIIVVEEYLTLLIHFAHLKI